jgi:DNA repair protein RadD
VPLPKECPSCTYLKPAKVSECPACGFKPEKRSDIEEEAGELVQVSRGKAKAGKDEKQLWYSSLQAIARQFGYKAGWVARTYQMRFGVWPKGLNEFAYVTPPDEVRSYVKHLRIAYAKSRHAA